MILLVHMMFGSAMGYLAFLTTGNWILGVFVALLSHYFLDFFPHIEYIESMKKAVEIVRSTSHEKYKVLVMVVADFFLPFIIMFLMFGSHAWTLYLFALAAAFPDSLTALMQLWPNKFLLWHQKIHGEIIHYLTKQKNFPLFWKVFTQAAAFVIGIIILGGKN